MRCKWLAMLLCLLMMGSACAEERFVFGQSEMGRDLTCVRLGDEAAEKSLLMTFAVHGFEDAYDHDGQLLVEIAELLIAHYDADPSGLNGHTLYIVPCVNPDGLLDGTTRNGFGRANANGIDINRDFSARWQKFTNGRNQTGDKPFASAEARAIRDLVEQIQPAWGVDVHGWIECVYGTRSLARPFMDAFDVKYADYITGGKLSQWLAKNAEAAVLVELPRNPGGQEYVQDCAQKLIAGLDAWFAAQ